MTLLADPEDPAKFIQKASGRAPDFDLFSLMAPLSKCQPTSERSTGNKDSQTGHSGS
ncbi:hypothetical protein [Bradyrhizobium sp. BRP56]|uniref:hypothetical protein n=1 Tax=Bradyrhizobium sp. BRP56 TaxID=2793819 RepID=UPI001CD4F6A9|nr:hypothetical protein [Bradyrhizobium sp. BRP56]MCA1401334.1 hypothetical protein [Bradyrhizobium sp. BRP56]